MPTIAFVPYCNTQDDAQDPRVHNRLLELQYMFQAFKDLQQLLSDSRGISRDEFLKLAGNLVFCCSTILKEMERLEGAGLNVEVDGKLKSDLSEELVEYTRLESFGVSVNDICSPTSAEDVLDLLESASILTVTDRLNMVLEAVV